MSDSFDPREEHERINAQSDARQLDHPLAAHDSKHPWVNFSAARLTGPQAAPDYLVQGAIAAGFVLIGGARGSGKTTCLLPLFMRTCHLCRPTDPLRPEVRRRVFYITEDIEQAANVLRSAIMSLRQEGPNGEPGMQFTEEQVNDLFRLVPANRINVGRAVQVAPEWQALALANTREDGTTYMAPPAIVLDTLAANLSMAEENSNAEASAIIAQLRQALPDFPIVIIAHTPKTANNMDIKTMTVRGASSLESDVQQVAYLVMDEHSLERQLIVGGGQTKRRFESNTESIAFQFVRNTVPAVTKLGNRISHVITHGEPTALNFNEARKAKEDAKAQSDKTRMTAMRTEALKLARHAQENGTPLGKTELVNKVGMHKPTVTQAVEDLIGEAWLVPVDVPTQERHNNSKGQFLIALIASERDAFREGGQLPAACRAKYRGWHKHQANHPATV